MPQIVLLLIIGAIQSSVIVALSRQQISRTRRVWITIGNDRHDQAVFLKEPTPLASELQEYPSTHAPTAPTSTCFPVSIRRQGQGPFGCMSGADSRIRARVLSSAGKCTVGLCLAE